METEENSAVVVIQRMARSNRARKIMRMAWELKRLQNQAVSERVHEQVK
jgi:hypothetical protein